MENEARRILVDVLGVPSERIDDSLRVNSLPQWDSAAHIGLMLELERAWGIEITEAAIIQCASFAGLSAFLSGLDANRQSA